MKKKTRQNAFVCIFSRKIHKTANSGIVHFQFPSFEMQPVHSFVWAMHFKTDTHFRVLCVSLTRTCDTYASNDTNYVCCCCLCVWAPLHCVWMCVCGHEVHFLPTTRQNTSSRRGTHHTHTGVERERERVISELKVKWERSDCGTAHLAYEHDLRRSLAEGWLYIKP